MGFTTASVSNCPTFCVYGANEKSFDRFAAVTKALCDRHQRFGLVLMAGDPAMRHSLVRRYPNATIVEPPAGVRRYRATWAKRLKLKCLIALDPIEELDTACFSALRHRAVPIVVLARWTGAASPSLLRAPVADHYLVGENAALTHLRGAGIGDRQITFVDGIAAREEIESAAAARIVDAVSPFLAQHAALARSRRPRPWHRLELMLLWCLSPSRIRRLESIAALREALGEPQRILCLGNGPSSEDRGLGEVSYDRLFRVNDRWLGRGFLTEPDMVFTGSKKTLVKVRGAVFAFSSVEIETMLLRKWLAYSPFRRLTYFTPERAGLLPSDPAETFNPTNGAIMLATAVALAPRSLIVAGIDLFSDPRGAYPGADATANAYAAAHDRNSEVRVIMEVLDGYRGELLILGDVLRENWAAYRRSRAPAVH